MPSCCICRRQERLFRFPRDAERRNMWMHLIGKHDINDNSRICDLHFSEEAFETKRLDGKRKLKPNSVPNLCQYSRCQCVSEDTQMYENVTLLESSQYLAHDAVTSMETEKSPGGDGENDFEPNPSCNRQEEVIHNLRTQLKKALRERNKYKQELDNVSRELEICFNEDQMNYIKKGNARGHLWSENTMNKALKLYMSCGAKGFEEIRRQHIPLPSIRTIQHRLRGIQLNPGILEDIFKMLKYKVSMLREEEKHAVLQVDEMAIQPGLQIDSSTGTILGRPTMKNAAGGYDNYATQALVFLIAGISTRWKQTIAYEYTGKSFSAEEMQNKLFTAIRKCHDIGLHIKAIISDMGGQNRGFWKRMNINASRHSHIQNSIAHPVRINERLYVIPDCVHIFKNIAAALTNGRKFYIDMSIVQREQLPSNVVCIEAIKKVFELDQNDPLKLCPRLKQNVITPSHFDKMNVSLSVALLHHDVGAAINYHIERKNIGPEHGTTAWFITLMYKWFKLMTGRSCTYAISHEITKTYETTLVFFEDFINIIRNITVDDNVWKPFQTGMLLATQSAIDLHRFYLNDEGFKYLLLSRFTQDALENLFSQIRHRTPVPNTREFKVALRLICLSQFEGDIRRGSYHQNDQYHLIGYCNEINALNDKITSTSTENSIVEIPDEICENLQNCELSNELSETAKSALYYFVGTILAKVKEQYLVCEDCFVPLLSSRESSLGLFTKFKEYKENLLHFPSEEFYKYFEYCEIQYRLNEESILDNTIDRYAFLDKLYYSYHSVFLDNIPQCHNIVYKCTKIFIRCRRFFSVKENNAKKTIKFSSKTSRTLAMKNAIINI